MACGDWGDNATSQGASGATRSQKGGGEGPFPTKTRLCPYLDFGLELRHSIAVAVP